MEDPSKLQGVKKELYDTLFGTGAATDVAEPPDKELTPAEEAKIDIYNTLFGEGTREEVQAKAVEKARAEREAKMPKTWAGELGAAIPRSIDELQETLYGAGAVWGPEATKNWFIGKMRQQQQEAAENPPSVATWKDANTWDQKMRYSLGLIGSGVPQIADSTATALIGAAFGSAAPGAGTVAGAGVGFFGKKAVKNIIKSKVDDMVKAELKNFVEGKIKKEALSEVAEAILKRETLNVAKKTGVIGLLGINAVAQQSGSIYSDLLDNPNVSETDRKTAAIVGGIISAIPDTAFGGWIYSKFFPGVKNVGREQMKAANNYLVEFVKQYGKDVVKVMPTEGIQEVSQSVVEMAAQNWADPAKRDNILKFSDEQKSSLVDAFFGGAAMGVTASGVAALGSMPHPDPKVRAREKTTISKANDLTGNLVVNEDARRLEQIAEQRGVLQQQLSAETDEAKKTAIQSKISELEAEETQVMARAGVGATAPATTPAVNPLDTATKETPVNAIWKNKDNDKPVVIVGQMGEKDGVIYYQTADGTGIPGNELTVTEDEEPIQPGMVRFYTGGVLDPNKTGKWVSPSRKYAEGYAAKSEGGVVQYIDVPEDSPFLKKAFDDTGTSMKAPYVSFEATDEMMANAKLIGKSERQLTPAERAIEQIRSMYVQKGPTGKGYQKATPVARANKVAEITALVNEIAPNDEAYRNKLTEVLTNDNYLNMLAHGGIRVTTNAKAGKKKTQETTEFLVDVTDDGIIELVIPKEEDVQPSEISHGHTVEQIEKILGHESIHIADNLWRRDKYDSSPEIQKQYGSLSAFIKANDDERGKALRDWWNSLTKAEQGDYPGIQRQLRLVYEPGEKGGATFEQTSGEMVRMMVELARTGELSETTDALVQAQREAGEPERKGKISDFLAKWLDALSNIHKTLLRLMNFETAPKEMVKAFNEVQQVMDKYGVMANELAKETEKKKKTTKKDVAKESAKEEKGEAKAEQPLEPKLEDSTLTVGQAMLVNAKVEYEGERGRIVEEEDGAFVVRTTEADYVLPSNTSRDMPLADIGVKMLRPTQAKKQIRAANKELNEAKPEVAQQELQAIVPKEPFWFTEASTHPLLNQLGNLVELGQSKISPSRKKLVESAPEFQKMVDEVSDDQLNRAENIIIDTLARIESENLPVSHSQPFYDLWNGIERLREMKQASQARRDKARLEAMDQTEREDEQRRKEEADRQVPAVLPSASVAAEEAARDAGTTKEKKETVVKKRERKTPKGKAKVAKKKSPTLVNEKETEQKNPAKKEIAKAVDKSLTEPEKTQVAKLLGHEKFTKSALNDFVKLFSDWVAGAVKVKGNLLKLLKKVSSFVNKTALSLTIVFAPLTSNSSYQTSRTTIPVEIVEPVSFEAPAEPRTDREKASTSVVGNRNEILSNGKVAILSSVIGVSMPRGIESGIADFQGETASSEVKNTADWIVFNEDNKGKSFFVGDKVNGFGYMFSDKGVLLHKFPALYGKDIGDFLAKGKKITPSGRFDTDIDSDPSGILGETLDLTSTGDGESVVAVHRLYLEERSEQRDKRLSSESPIDNRISHGCINCSNEVFEDVILPSAELNGVVVYILPESGGERIALEPESTVKLSEPKRAAKRQKERIKTTAVLRGGEIYVGDKPNSPHNRIGTLNLDAFPEILQGKDVPQSERGFIIVDEEGNERFTNDRDEAAGIANAAGQAPVTKNLQSEDLIEDSFVNEGKAEPKSGKVSTGIVDALDTAKEIFDKILPVVSKQFEFPMETGQNLDEVLAMRLAHISETKAASDAIVKEWSGPLFAAVSRLPIEDRNSFIERWRNFSRTVGENHAKGLSWMYLNRIVQSAIKHDFVNEGKSQPKLAKKIPKEKQAKINRMAGNIAAFTKKVLNDLEPGKSVVKQRASKPDIEGLEPQDLEYASQPHTDSARKAQAKIDEFGLFKVVEVLQEDPLGRELNIVEDSEDGLNYGQNAVLKNVFTLAMHHLTHIREKMIGSHSFRVSETAPINDMIKELERINATLGTTGGQASAATNKASLFINAEIARRDYEEPILNHLNKVFGANGRAIAQEYADMMNDYRRQYISGAIDSAMMTALFQQIQSEVHSKKWQNATRKQIAADAKKSAQAAKGAAKRAAIHQALDEGGESFLNKTVEWLLNQVKFTPKEVGTDSELEVLRKTINGITIGIGREVGIIPEAASRPQPTMLQKFGAIMKNNALYNEFVDRFIQNYIAHFGGETPSKEFLREADDIRSKMQDRWMDEMVDQLVNEKMRQHEFKFSEIVKKVYQTGENIKARLKTEVAAYMKEEGVTDDGLINTLVNEIDESFEEHMTEARKRFFTSTAGLNLGLKHFRKSLMTMALEHETYAANMDFAEFLVEEYYIPADIAVTIASIMTKELNKKLNGYTDKNGKYHEGARERALKGLVKKIGNPKVQRKVDESVQKIIKLANVGVMQQKDIYMALQEKFGLPPYSEEVAKEIARMGDEIGNLSDPRSRDIAIQRLGDMLVANKGITSADVYISMFYTSILSGIATHGVNAMSNAFAMLGYTTVQSVKHPTKILPMLRAMVRAMVGSGFLEARETFFTGMTLGKAGQKYDNKKSAFEYDSPLIQSSLRGRKIFGLNIDALAKIDEFITKYAQKLIRGVKGHYVGRALMAVDVFFYKVAQEIKYATKGGELAEGWMYESAMRQARAVVEGQNKDPDTNRADNRRMKVLAQGYLEKMRAKSPASIAAWEETYEFALEGTFNQDPKGWLGMIHRGIKKGTNEYPVGKLIIPFTKIVANVTNHMIEWTPYGFVRYGFDKDFMLGKPDALKMNHDIAIRAALGSALIIAFMSLFVNEDEEEPYFTVYGEGPKDLESKHQLMNRGWKPHTIKVGDSYISYLYTPVGMTLAMIGDMMDKYRAGEIEKPSVTNLSMVSMASTMLRTATDQSFLAGMTDIMKAVESPDPVGKLSKIFARTASAFFVPNLVKQVDKWMNPTIQEADSTWEYFIREFPLARTSLKPMLNVFGEEVKRTNMILPGMERFISTVRTDEVWRTVGQKRLRIPGYSKSNHLGDNVMTPEQYYEFIQLSGPLIKEEIQASLNLIKEMTREEAQDYIEGISRSIKSEVKGEMLSRLQP